MGKAPTRPLPFSSLENITDAQFIAVLSSGEGGAGEGGTAIWEPVAAEQARKHLSPDLHRVVDRILHGGGAVQAQVQGHLPFRVRRDFLTDEFVIELPPAAAQRLRKGGVAPEGAHHIRFRFHDINAYLISTGIGPLTMEVESKAPIGENGGKSVYALSHPENKRQRILNGKLQKKIT